MLDDPNVVTSSLEVKNHIISFTGQIRGFVDLLGELVLALLFKPFAGELLAVVRAKVARSLQGRRVGVFPIVHVIIKCLDFPRSLIRDFHLGGLFKWHEPKTVKGFLLPDGNGQRDERGVLSVAGSKEISNGGKDARVRVPVPVNLEDDLPQVILLVGVDRDPDVVNRARSFQLGEDSRLPGLDLVLPLPVVVAPCFVVG